MGQYYTVVNVDKEEFLEPYDYDSFSKIMEHSWRRNHYMGVVAQLLLKGNEWYKNRITWCGDYITREDFNIEKYIIEIDQVFKKFKSSKYYKGLSDEEIMKKIGLNDIKNISFKEIKPDFNVDEFESIIYFFNESKKEYFNLSESPKNKDGWQIHPLSLLTCTCNHSGGSYYADAGAEYISTWKGDIIFSAKSLDEVENLEEYKLINPGFIEE